jgi:pilus assembly protein CpaF
MDMFSKFSRFSSGSGSGGSDAGTLVLDAPAQPMPVVASAEQTYLKTKLAIHRRLIEEIDLSTLDTMPETEVRRAFGAVVRNMATEEKLPLNAVETAQLVEDVLHEMLGLGPLEPLLKDPTINDILVNTPNQVYVERAGVLELSPVRFADDAHVLRILNRIVAAVGRRVDESSPMVDARLPDGSRVNAVIAPVAVDGPLISIRKFSRMPFNLERLIAVDSMRPAMADFLRACVAARVSMVISGGTGSGKTTLLNALSSCISPRERLLTIEDAAELQLQQPHVCRMETRPANLEGEGEIRQRELVKNALRMRPDRIIIGECRADEAFDLLQAMNTGHEGSLTTVHANTPRDAMSRLEQMVAMASMGLTSRGIRQQIASAIRIVVQTQRLSDGRRRVTSISEIVGMEEDVIQVHEIFRYSVSGLDAQGAVLGRFEATGMRPQCLPALAAAGISLPPGLFDPSKEI